MSSRSEVWVNLWGLIPAKALCLVCRRPELFRNFLGSLRLILCHWKTFSIPNLLKSRFLIGVYFDVPRGMLVLSRRGLRSSLSASGQGGNLSIRGGGAGGGGGSNCCNLFARSSSTTASNTTWKGPKRIGKTHWKS